MNNEKAQAHERKLGFFKKRKLKKILKAIAKAKSSGLKKIFVVSLDDDVAMELQDKGYFIGISCTSRGNISVSQVILWN